MSCDFHQGDPGPPGLPGPVEIIRGPGAGGSPRPQRTSRLGLNGPKVMITSGGFLETRVPQASRELSERAELENRVPRVTPDHKDHLEVQAFQEKMELWVQR
ncbi:hypothetical protein AGIG_G10166 [Arapaima gigas]